MKALDLSVDDVIETGILIFGGGLAGCMAALTAKENNNEVTVIEKACISRSGDAGLGLDHYPAIAHPLLNGISAEEYGIIRANDFPGIVSQKLSIITSKFVIKPIKILEDIGVKICEEDGSLKVHGLRLGGIWGVQQDFADKKHKIWDSILYRGADLKYRLSQAIEKKGVKIYERTLLTSLITNDNRVIGATALNVRNGKFILFKSNTIILATGGMQSRLYQSNPFVTYPNMLFTHYHCPANAGGGHAAAYRAGAKLVNVEFLHVRNAPLGRDPGPPAGTLYSKLVNSKGEELRNKYPNMAMQEKAGGIPFMSLPFKPNMLNPEIERDSIKWQVDHISEAAEEHGYFMAASETPSLLRSLKERGGIRAAPFDIGSYYHGLPRSLSGIKFDENGETSLKGLYVAGDMVGGLPLYGASGAFAWGYKIGKYLKEAKNDNSKCIFNREHVEKVRSEKKRVNSPLTYRGGIDPLRLEHLVREIVTNFIGIRRSGPRLERCIEFISIIKKKYAPSLMAKNFHELMRALEVQDIIDIADIHARTALLRTESRMPPSHYRTDYPNSDDAHWRTSIIVNNVAGEMKHNLETLE